MESTAHSPHRQPNALDEHASKTGLRTVATFEATKGVLALALAITLFVVRDHIEDVAAELLYHLHIGFEHRWAQRLLHGASTFDERRIWGVMAGAFSYAAVRFTEAWGLWHQRVWAEWFALLSGALYLPLEIVAIFEHPHWVAITLLVSNLAIVLYMLEIRVREVRLQRKAG
jgi:uncharacterized membrane protein (DUF2068 family)